MRFIPVRFWIAGLIAMTAMPLASSTVDIAAQRAYLKTASGSTEVSSPIPGQTVYFAVDFGTTGLSSPVLVSYRALLDGVVFCSGSGSPTAVPGSATLMCSQGWAAKPGGHSVRWDLDYTNAVAETNEYNNSATVAFTVSTSGAAPTLDIVAERAYVMSLYGSQVPSPTPGQMVYLCADIQITGTGTFGGLTTRILLDGAPLMTWTVPSVYAAPLEGPALGYPWVATAGTHRLEFDLNYDNSVPETSASNNTAVAVFTVSSPGGAANLAAGKTATQSSTLAGTQVCTMFGCTPPNSASWAVDGSTDGNFADGALTSTNQETNAWWQVDLGASAAIGPIAIWNRTDCCGSRLSDYWVFVSDTPFLPTDTPVKLQNRAGTFASHQTAAPNPSTTIAANTEGRYVRVQLTGADYLSLAEVQVFGQIGLTASHIGNFMQGQPLAMYTITVHNNNTSSAVGTGIVTVAADTLPAGFTATAIAAPGWTCTLTTVSCSRSDPIPAGGSYPPITVTVSVAANAPAPSMVLNWVGLSGGLGKASATDSIVIQPPFADVNPTDPFLPAIDLLGESSITSGCRASPPGYCPNDNITLGQMAVFVVRSVMGNDNFTYTTTPYFTDVPATHPFFKWIQKMQGLGIALPCGPNLYCPDTPVTRGVMAVLIIRGRYGVATPSNYPATPYFSDVASNHPYFPWIQKMKQLGITSGCSLAGYCPDNPVTRGQMAVFIMRGEFNQLLLATAPAVVWASPAGASAGKTVTVNLAGQNTHFVTGVTQVSAGAGIAVSNISVVNATTLTAQFAVAAGATLGPRSITVTTGSEEATLPNGFQVQQ